MNKFKTISLLIALLSLASCSSDDKPTNLANETVGSYKGFSVASSSYFSNMIANNQEVTISTNEINKVNISYQSDTWGTITISGSDLTGSEGNVHISGAGKSVMAHAGSEAKEYDCTVSGTLIGKTLNLTFSCPAVMGGLKIEFKQGEIPADIVVPGTYNGYTEAKSAYFSGMTADDQTIVITKNSDDSYKVVYNSDSWGEFFVDNVIAKYENGKFLVSGNGTTKMGMEGNIKEYDCSFEGSIDPEKENPSFTFSIPAVMGGLSIVFNTGDRPAAE